MEGRKRNRRLGRWLLAGLVLSGILYLDNNTLGVQEYAVQSDALPAAFDGFRILQVSDLHGKSFGKDHERLLEAAAKTNPDLIAITGDLADEQTDLPSLAPLLTGLRNIAPVYFVTGNHEWSLKKDERQTLFSMLEQADVRWLKNEYLMLGKDDAKIVLAGADDKFGPADQKKPKEVVDEIRAEHGDDAYILMLSHRNDELDLWAKLGVQTVLCGHAHGGVVRLPMLGGVFGTSHEFFPEYDAGVFTKNETTMVISRGLGGHKLLPVRVCNRPELVTVILERENP
ncbi:MAG: metallophosphoesterase [Oscillospiraceae bacterium]|nr:metallophosphoesterase [Oscillospiraceae bacterium]